MQVTKQVLFGRVEGVYATLTRQSLVSTPFPEIQATLEGFAGDVHSGFIKPAGSREERYPRGEMVRNNRQVSLVSLEELAEVAAAMGVPAIRAEWLGANLAVSGIPRLTHLPPFTRLFFASGAVLIITSENKPCIHPGRVIHEQYPQHSGLADAFVKQALHRRGLVAVVERAGRISTGDKIRVELPHQELYLIS